MNSENETPKLLLPYIVLPLAILIGLGVLLSYGLCGCGPDERAAKLAAAKVELSNVAAALNQFRLDAGRYPTESEGLHLLILRPPDNPRGPYFKRLPTDPWGKPYDYEPLSDGGYRIASHGQYSSKDPDPALTIVRHGDSDFR